MPFPVKDWRDQPDHTTPISAAALEDLETRFGAYADLAAQSLGVNYKGVWSSGTTYARGDGVSKGTTNYISTVGGNLNNDPAVDTGAHWSLLPSGAGLLPAPTGGDDAAALNTFIAAAAPGSQLTGRPGTYLINSASLKLYPNIEYDFTLSTFAQTTTTLGKPLIVNKAQTPVATATDVATTGVTYTKWTVTAGTATGGTGTWSFVWAGVTYTTPSIAFNATAAVVAAAVQAAIGSHGEILPGACVGAINGPLGTASVVITFTGNVTTDVSAMAIATNAYTGGTGPTFVHTTTGVAGSATITSATLAAVAVPGQTIGIIGAGPAPNASTATFVANIGTVNSGTGAITLVDCGYGLPSPVFTTVAGASASLYTRDALIRIRGGTVNRTDTSGTVGQTQSLNSVTIRHCDGFEWYQPNFQSVTGTKYALGLGDITDFTVHVAQLLHLGSDGIHIDGNSYRGSIHTVKGITGDDFVALTARNYPNTEDCPGPIVDISITDLHSHNGKGVCLAAGPGELIQSVTVSEIYGVPLSGARAVRIVDDPGSNGNDVGGIYDDIIIRDNHTRLLNGNSSLCEITASGIRHLTFDGVYFDSTATGIPAIFNQSAAGQSIEHLTIRDVHIRSMPAGAVPVVNVNGTILRLTIDGGRIINAGSGNIVTLSNAAAQIQRLMISNLLIDGGSGSSIVQAATAGQVLGSVHLNNVRLTNTAWLADLNTATTIYGANVQLGPTMGSGIINVRANGNVRLVGQFDTQQNVISSTVAGGGFLSVNAPGMYMSSATVNGGKTGDQFYNTSTPAGPVIVMPGGTVTPASPTATGVATLVAGTSGAIANASITANSRLRLTNTSAGGTVGALSTVLNAGVGFTINSTSGTDTSKVYWEVVQY